MKKSPDGKITKLAEGKFKNVRWMMSTRQGVLYFIDAGERLFKIDTDGKISELANDLGEVSSVMTVSDQNHNAYGPWIDKDNNVYVPLLDSRKVKRITPGGNVETVLYTSQGWGPASGLFDDNGNLWLLEYGGGFDTRVRKIEKQEFGKQAGGGRNLFLSLFLPFFLVTGFVVAFVLLLIRFYRFLSRRMMTTML